MVARDLDDYLALASALLSATVARRAAPECVPQEKPFSARVFMHRWRRALSLMAEAPHAHLVVAAVA